MIVNRPPFLCDTGNSLMNLYCVSLTTNARIFIFCCIEVYIAGVIIIIKKKKTLNRVLAGTSEIARKFEDSCLALKCERSSTELNYLADSRWLFWCLESKHLKG